MAEKKVAKHPQTFPLYTPAGFYMVRTPVLPAHTFTDLVATETHSGDIDAVLQAQREYTYQQLQALAVQPQIEQALAVASFSLFDALKRLQQSTSSTARTERTYSSLLRYITRMSTRPTPFGLFAGIALGEFSSETKVQMATPSVERIRTRPDMNWLLSILQTVEETPELVRQLHVSVNQTMYSAGGRIMLPFADTYGTQDNRTISLRATSVVRKALELARSTILYSDLLTALLKAFSRATEQQIDRLLWQLWENRFLISNLHPPLTDASPAEYIYKQLKSVHGAEEICKKLRTVLVEVAALDHAGIGAPVKLFHDLAQSQEQLVPNEQKKLQAQVDTALHLKSSELNRSIGSVAAQAAEILLRMTPIPEGPQQLQEYRTLFLEHYGENVEMPLLDLLSPENGLDAPPGYNEPPRTYHQLLHTQRPDTSKRDRHLQALVVEAVNDRSIEVELTPALLEQLERWSPNIGTAPLSLEIYLQVLAKSREELDAGKWCAVVGQNCGSPAAGRTFGRFFDLLGDPGMEALQHMAKREETLFPHAIFAELSYQPKHARSANVAVRPSLRSYEIVVGTTPSVPAERVIPLNDLVVGVNASRFYLRSLSLGKQVIVCQGHMLNMFNAPNVCRFIAELGQDGIAGLNAFDWSSVSDSPFLPRLVVKVSSTSTLVLSPAQWNLRADTIVPIGQGSEEARWFQSLQHWRTQWRVPRYVYLTESDNRLLLDLEHPLMVAELHSEVTPLNEGSHVNVQELLPDFENLWLKGEQGESYFSEIVVPLLRTDAVEPEAKVEHKVIMRIPPPRIITQKERSFFPGDAWTYFKLYAAPQQHDEIIAGPLRTIVQALQAEGMIDRWFFIRYSDPEPHLRLRFHARQEKDIQPMLATILQWSRQQVEVGLLRRYMLDTYEREVERYGGPTTIDLFEQIFTIDSTITSNIISARVTNRLSLDEVAIAVFTLDYFFAALGRDFQQRLLWTQNNSEKYTSSKEFRPQRNLYCDLLAPWENQIEVETATQREYLLELVKPQEEPLGKLADQFRKCAEQEALWMPEETILGSLAHMHINRLLGINPPRERQIYAFWRHTLDSLHLRPEKKSPL